MSPPSPHPVAVFTLDARPFALNVSKIEQVLRAVAITPLQEAPAGVTGVIDVRGRIIPVFDLRVRLGKPPRQVRASDHLVLAHAQDRVVALLVENVIGVVPAGAAGVMPADEILPELRGIEGVMALEGDIILIHDLDRLLSSADEKALASALRE